jgi:hypothetical protein
MSLNLFLFKIKVSDLMFRRNKKVEEKTEAKKAQTTYRAMDGVRSDETGGLYSFGSNIKPPYEALSDITSELGLQGFGYVREYGFFIDAESLDAAKQKLASQKNRVFSIENLNKIEEKWIEKAKNDLNEKGKNPKEIETEIKRYTIPEELKRELVGKTAPEAVWGLEIDYEKLIKDLH